MPSPEETLPQLKKFFQSLEEAKSKAVYVGLPKEKIGGAVYKGGKSVLEIGAIHEYGAPEQGIPMRSFIRVPFDMKKAQLQKTVQAQFAHVAKGKDAIEALDLIGLMARGISQQAFTAKGYGTWRGLAPATVASKGSSQPLIDTNTLRGSLTWVVR